MSLISTLNLHIVIILSVPNANDVLRLQLYFRDLRAGDASMLNMRVPTVAMLLAKRCYSFNNMCLLRCPGSPCAKPMPCFCYGDHASAT